MEPKYALVLVDTDPMWLWGHTMSDKDTGCADGTSIRMAELNVRLHDLLTAIESDGMDIPVLAFHTGTYDLYCLSSLKDRIMLLTGLYGGECVLAAEEWLVQCGFEVKVLRDMVLWGFEETPSGSFSADVITGFDYGHKPDISVV